MRNEQTSKHDWIKRMSIFAVLIMMRINKTKVTDRLQRFALVLEVPWPYHRSFLVAVLHTFHVPDRSVVCARVNVPLQQMPRGLPLGSWRWLHCAPRAGHFGNLDCDVMIMAWRRWRSETATANFFFHSCTKSGGEGKCLLLLCVSFQFFSFNSNRPG